MRWTSERPTVQGWYWRRDADDAPIFINEVYEDTDDGLCVDYGSGTTKLIAWCNTTQWAGPIPEPEDGE